MNKETYQPEIAGGVKYRDIIGPEIRRLRIGDYLRYDKEGYLWINGLRVIDGVKFYGSPLEIVDTTITERRCQEWASLTQQVAKEVGFTGGFEYTYANKANPAAEVAMAAYRSGWGAETSGVQDLANIRWLREHGLINKNIRVICNGFKLPPQCYGYPERISERLKSQGITFVDKPRFLDGTQEISYADYICLMRELGFNIIPVLDSGELNFFAQKGEIPSMEIGLRLKFGKVTSDFQLEEQVSRHGMSWKELLETAAKIEDIDHLKFTMLHTMVGAAETIPVDVFVNSLLFAADKYFFLKQKGHRNLRFLNIGGGVPPLGEDYNHQEFLRRFLGGLVEKAKAVGYPQPTVVFELGSLVAAESGFHVFKIVQNKGDWVIVDGGLMAAIPDMLIIGKEFKILAANNANHPGRQVRLGDLSCDSDGRYPSKSMEPKKVLIPNTDEETYLVFVGVGAYQEALVGVRGAHHCGLLEAAELILERRSDGKVYGRVMPRQTESEGREILGYRKEFVEALRATLRK